MHYIFSVWVRRLAAFEIWLYGGPFTDAGFIILWLCLTIISLPPNNQRKTAEKHSVELFCAASRHFGSISCLRVVGCGRRLDLISPGEESTVKYESFRTRFLKNDDYSAPKAALNDIFRWTVDQILFNVRALVSWATTLQFLLHFKWYYSINFGCSNSFKQNKKNKKYTLKTLRRECQHLAAEENQR